MADVGHIGFLKFSQVTPTACYSASRCNISLKSGNRLLSYGQYMAAVRHLEF